jgi:hypothetical protein
MLSPDVEPLNLSDDEECDEDERTVATARGALGEEAFEAAWVRGHALPLEEAITDTLNNDE